MPIEAESRVAKFKPYRLLQSQVNNIMGLLGETFGYMNDKGLKEFTTAVLSKIASQVRGRPDYIFYQYVIDVMEIENYEESLLKRIFAGTITSEELNAASAQLATVYNVHFTIRVYLRLRFGSEDDNPESHHYQDHQYSINNATIFDMVTIFGGNVKLRKILEQLDTQNLIQYFDPDHTLQVCRDEIIMPLSSQQIISSYDEMANNACLAWVPGFGNNDYLLPFIQAKFRCGMALTEQEEAKLHPPGILETAYNVANKIRGMLSGFANYTAISRQENAQLELRRNFTPLRVAPSLTISHS